MFKSTISKLIIFTVVLFLFFISLILSQIKKTALANINNKQIVEVLRLPHADVVMDMFYF